MGKIDAVYKQLLYAITENGFEYQDIRRKDVKKKQLKDARFELLSSDGFPLLTLKRMAFKQIVSELLWFLKGQTNVFYLHKDQNHIWDKDAYNLYIKRFDEHLPNSSQNKLTFKEFVDRVQEAESVESLLDFQGLGLDYNLGDVGKNYSHQWTNFEGEKNQIFDLVRNLRDNPMDTRHLVTAWNPDELDQTALPACHWAFEVLVAPTPKFKQKEEGWPEYNFSLKWHQRSVDTFLGLPFNVASYALLSIFLQPLVKMHYASLIADLSNVHIYSNHYEAVKEMEPRLPLTYGSPEVTLSDNAISLLNSINVSLLSETSTVEQKREDFEAIMQKFTVEDFILHHYESFDKIPAKMVAPDKI